MERTTTYRQLQAEERMTIASLMQQGCSVRAMARTLGRAPSTVLRELGRNAAEAATYAASTAQQATTARRDAARPSPKLHRDGILWGVVTTLLAWKYSPQQIAGTLRRVHPDRPELHVSHETIYTAIYAHARGELRRQLICLPAPRPCKAPAALQGQ